MQEEGDAGSTPQTDCAICWSPYNNTFQTPKLLLCQHSFCLECLARMSLTLNPDAPGGLTCPLCRRVTPMELGQPITELPTDQALLASLQLQAMPMVVEEGRLYYATTSHKPWFLPQRPTVYTLSLDVERRLRINHNQVHPALLSAESPPSPQFCTFTLVMLAVVVGVVMLILSLYWTRQGVWGLT
ncbi:E3 ubiquitin-protein ligase RNF183-like [Polyodon spathula]|uniref:E3 ubiquitin-protein ligase RNF183-like n=1 Tax=Polyodon spathula TaxID=7913 RepID=UPI001B7F4FA9|nr:E3 ubiquitin-protein ligase RNF183-like [Polyodon spathula]